MIKISNVLSKIQNANLLHKDNVFIYLTKFNKNLCDLLLRQGLIKSYKLHETEIEINLKYTWDDKVLFHSFKIISKKRVRKYQKKPLNFGEKSVITVISTNLGLKTLDECFQYGVGGEVLFYIYL